MPKSKNDPEGKKIYASDETNRAEKEEKAHKKIKHIKIKDLMEIKEIILHNFLSI